MVFLFLMAFSALWYFSSGLPDYKKLATYQPPVSSRVYSENGTLLAEYALEKRLFIPYDSIPSKVINSFLSAEDKNFFSHPGIDARGIMRAVVNNFKNVLQSRRLREPLQSHSKLQKTFCLQTKFRLEEKLKKQF